MVIEDQSEVVAFLESPAAHAGAPVERVDTHASMVFLSGDRALKLKRAVRYDYLDFSTVEKRKAMCEAELRVNVRSAPAIYRSVLPVTREPDGSLALGGHGAAVEWLLHMARFDQAFLLDRLAERGELPHSAMAALAQTIASFHSGADRRPDFGGADAMRRVVEGNAAGFLAEGGVLDADLCRGVTEASLQAIERHRALLDYRREGGFVRHCHGDLHLRNIVLLDGAPTLFDGIEFNDDIACVDVLYDLAFLLMDLWHRELPRHANAVCNGYLIQTNDLDGLPLLPLFLSCRAAIRAKTSVTQTALVADAEARTRLVEIARKYIGLADELSRPVRPRLVAVGGLSGSGKSTVALALAPGIRPAPGAVVLRSDEIRKSLCGVQALTRLGTAGYTPEMSRRVYGALADRAARILRHGHSVVIDAVFLDSSDRQAIEGLARALGVTFAGIWLEAPAEVLVRRVANRQGDPSDADADVVRGQLQRDPGPIEWPRVLAEGETDAVVAATAGLLLRAAGRG
jgi:aminoglycoside phosphotransferase family enzyme/predicted kinase